MKFLPLIVSSLLFFSGASVAQETPRYDVVAEFVHQLSETKKFQDIATRDMAESAKLKPAERSQRTLTDIIRNGTRVNLQLRLNVNMLNGMTLNKPFETVIPYLITVNEEKLKLYEELIEIAKILIKGPQKGVDYSKFSARLPEITAEMEYIEESIFKVTPMVFALLIDQKSDSKNHLSHLIITKEQGKKLIASLNNEFGSSMDDKNQNWTVSSASVLKSYLTKKNFKFADDPRK